jgi:MFS family permease
MSVSLLIYFIFAPRALVSIFIGKFIDKYSKKKIIIITDTISALCTLVVVILMFTNRLTINHKYIINVILGTMEGIQSPASAVAVGILVPKHKYGKIGGLISITENLNIVLFPMLATAIMGFAGIEGILLFDIASFLFAILIMIFFIKIPDAPAEEKKEEMLSGFKEGFSYLKTHKGILYIIIAMALLNFLSRLSYENILSPMILARSNDSEFALGVVTSLIGLGGILGGLLVATIKLPKNKVKMLFYSAVISFLLGDLMMAFGQNVYFWGFAAIAASLPIPFTFSAQLVLIYNNVETNIQGRVFAVRNAMNYTAIMLGILLGGAISEYIFEPFIRGSFGLAAFLRLLVGDTKGSGMALMFICTGIIGAISCLLFINNRHIKKLMK